MATKLTPAQQAIVDQAKQFEAGPLATSASQIASSKAMTDLNTATTADIKASTAANESATKTLTGQTVSTKSTATNSNPFAGMTPEQITAKVTADNLAAATLANKQIGDRNALTLLQSTLKGYGIDDTGAIANGILSLQQKNYDAPTIQALIQDPGSIKNPDTAVAALAAAWQTRFSGNYGPNGRIAKGQPPLSPTEYIATENSYLDIVHAAGLPDGFYTSKGKMGELIGSDIAPTELQDRVNAAAKSIANADPFYTSTLQNYYGLSSAQMIAHALDPDAALPLIQREVAAATFGAAGALQGLNVDKNTANQYAVLGVTQAQAQQGFQQIAEALPTDQKLAQIYGQGGSTQFGTAQEQQGNLTAATFGGEGGAADALRLKKLQAQEVNAFSGSSGVDKNTFNDATAGGF